MKLSTKKLAVLLTIGLTFATQSSAFAGEPFPIMAWDYADDEATLQKMADCGINMVAFVPPEALDACEKVGIRAIVYQKGITPARWDQAFNSAEANAAFPN